MLNQQYDAYQKEHGLINSRGSAQAFQDDSSYFLLCSLEDLDEEGKFRGKSDMFSKRTIRSARPAERADTASDALALSIGEKACVDMPYMMQLTGKTEEELVDDLNGVIFIDPLERENDGGNLYRTADDYLSGNVRQKLQVAKIAAETNPAYRINVSALEQVQWLVTQISQTESLDVGEWEKREYLQQGLSRLPESDRLILELKYYNGYTAREIAEKLGMKQEAVKKRQQRALKKLLYYMKE